MPYIGRGLTSGAQYQKLDAITIDNATTFTMQVNSTAVTPPQEHVILAVNGVLQEPGVGFTVAGSTCTLASAIDNDGGTDTIWGVVAGAAAFNNGLFANTVTVGEDDTGYDVKFFGATSGDFLLWDESADQLVLSGTMKIKEQADADSDTAAYGQLWVNTATPNELYFTTDAGNDIAITSGTAIAAPVTALNNATANELVTVGSTTTELDAETNLTFDGTLMTLGGTAAIMSGASTTSTRLTIYDADDAQPAILEIAGNDNTDNASIGEIWFSNEQNADATNHDTDGKLVSKIQCLMNATGTDTAGEIIFHTKNTGAALTQALRIDAGQNLKVTGDIDMEDDKGIKFGSGDDFWFGAGAGESGLYIYTGGTQGHGTNEGFHYFQSADSGETQLQLRGGEGAQAQLFMFSDQADDAINQWKLYNTDTSYLFLGNVNNSASETFRFDDDGNAHADAAWEDNTWDYAEFFEWKTHLASDDTVKDLYGMSVVLDGDKVRVAESGEEDKILGVVRPKGSTAAHGDGLKWKGKYIQNVWGEYEMENYTNVHWEEFLPNGNVEYRHSYHKDEIPEYRLKDGTERELNHQTKEENFQKDKNGEKIPVVVPSTEEEKTSSGYTERTTHKSTGKTLTRRKYADDYDPSIPYIRRADRPKEWVLIGLLGQVPVRTSAVIPDHWVKQKDLESGIDFYYIFNK